MLNANTECFEGLSMNGILSNNLNLFPFVLSLSKDSGRILGCLVFSKIPVLQYSITPIFSSEVSHERRKR
jgi:hypothetical protein